MKYSFILLSTLFLFSCSTAQENNTFDIKGVAFEAPKTEVLEETFKPITDLGANFICLMPYAFTRNGKPDIQFNSNWQWVGEREEGVIQSIKAARINKLKIMIKPHLWIYSKFTGDVKFNNEEEWAVWEKSYAAYILFYAELAQKYKVEVFCIGTELKAFVAERPLFWSDLISEVKKLYDGEITYAANWDNYKVIPFWKEIDYIGIDAYFPLSDEKTPNIEVLKQNWEKWWVEIEAESKTNNRPVFFTEIGYRSVDFCTKEPWSSYDNLGEENQEAQANALTAFFESSKEREYFKGAFLWKWHCKAHLPDEGNKMYTFQNKKALEVISF